MESRWILTFKHIQCNASATYEGFLFFHISVRKFFCCYYNLEKFEKTEIYEKEVIVKQN